MVLKTQRPPPQPHQQCLYRTVNVYTLVIFYIKGHVDDHVLHVHVYIVPAMLAELLYPLQYDYTPLHLAAERGHTMCVEYLLSTPGNDVNIEDKVSWCI